MHTRSLTIYGRAPGAGAGQIRSQLLLHDDTERRALHVHAKLLHAHLERAQAVGRELQRRQAPGRVYEAHDRSRGGDRRRAEIGGDGGLREEVPESVTGTDGRTRRRSYGRP